MMRSAFRFAHSSSSALALVAGVFVTVACGGAPSDGRAGAASGLVKVDGSSTVFPITEAVAEDFQRATGGTKVTVGISGTGGGFEKFCRGETDVSNASRPISAQEVDACGKSNVAFIELPVAYDGLTVVVHPKNTWVESLTVAELKKLWAPEAQGQILKWNQIRPEWPDREIHLFGAGVDSGTFDYFTEAVVGKAKSSRGDYTSSEDDNVLVQGVSGDEFALGYFGLAYYEENRTRVKAVPIDGGTGEGPIMPSSETVRTSRYRPLSRPLLIYVAVSALARPEVKSFIDFFLGQAATLVPEVGYVPLTSREYELVRARAERQQTGTIYADHHAKPGVALESLLAGPTD